MAHRDGPSKWTNILARPGWESNPGFCDSKTSALTTRPRSLKQYIAIFILFLRLRAPYYFYFFLATLLHHAAGFALLIIKRLGPLLFGGLSITGPKH